MNKHHEMEYRIVSNEIPAVKLKGVGDGFWLTVNPDSPEEDIYKEISELFERLKHLAINAKVVVDLGNHQDNDNVVSKIELLLKSRFNVAIVTRYYNKRSDIHLNNNVAGNIGRNRQNSFSKGFLTDKSDALILTGRVRSGQKIETKNHLIIAGNVNPGAQLISEGNIIVLGTLLGQVYAGSPDDDEAFVMALDFRPSHVRIGSIITSGEFDAELNGKTIFATVQDNKIAAQDYLKIQPFGKIPWPTVM